MPTASKTFASWDEVPVRAARQRGMDAGLVEKVRKHIASKKEGTEFSVSWLAQCLIASVGGEKPLINRATLPTNKSKAILGILAKEGWLSPVNEKGTFFARTAKKA
jgi:hypothetical protein